MRYKTLLLCLSAFLMTGCTQTYLLKVDPQSHFDYPNSNIYPMGHVEGKVSKTSFGASVMGVADINSGMQYEAISKALEQKPGSDLIINSFHTLDVTSFLFFTTTTYHVDGTAAKMKAGEQVLR